MPVQVELTERRVPVGRAQHKDERVQVEAVRPFEPGLKALTERHPKLLKAFGKFSKWTNQMGTLGGGSQNCRNCSSCDRPSCRFFYTMVFSRADQQRLMNL